MDKIQHIKSVSFFGCSCENAGDPNFENAKDAARVIAQSGRRVINGGGPGVMLAATLGAKEAKGHTSVVYYTPDLATLFEGKSDTAANNADVHFEEPNYVMRTKKLLELGDAYIVFNGGTGTISEFAMAWGLARLYFGHHKPLLLYGNFWQEIMDSFKKTMLVRPEEYEVFTIVNSPSEVLAALDRYEQILDKNRHEHMHEKGKPESHLLL